MEEQYSEYKEEDVEFDIKKIDKDKWTKVLFFVMMVFFLILAIYSLRMQTDYNNTIRLLNECRQMTGVRLL